MIPKEPRVCKDWYTWLVYVLVKGIWAAVDSQGSSIRSAILVILEAIVCVAASVSKTNTLPHPVSSPGNSRSSKGASRGPGVGVQRRSPSHLPGRCEFAFLKSEPLPCTLFLTTSAVIPKKNSGVEAIHTSRAHLTHCIHKVVSHSCRSQSNSDKLDN